jgi:hypothetical protein
MSRSWKKVCGGGWSNAKSDKKSKRIAHKSQRRAQKIDILKEHETVAVLRDVSSVWEFDKDGKSIYETLDSLKTKFDSVTPEILDNFNFALECYGSAVVHHYPVSLNDGWRFYSFLYQYSMMFGPFVTWEEFNGIDEQTKVANLKKYLSRLAPK